MNDEVVCGRQPVRELLAAGRRPVRRLVVAANARGGAIEEIVARARERRIAIETAEPGRLDRLADGGHHQGLVAFAAPICYATLDEIWRAAGDRDPLVLVGDGIQDPQNLGNLIRSAEFLGAHGLIIPAHRAVGLTPAVARAAAGAVERLPVARVTNAATVLLELRERGLRAAGGVADGGRPPWELDLTGPLAVVVGSEGDGLRRLVRERCDLLVTLPRGGRGESLNVATAGAIILAEVVRQRAMKTS